MNTYSGVISGSGSLTKAGAGTLVLTTSHSYTGGTTLSSGTLQIGNGGISGSISGNVNGSGILDFNRSDSIAISTVFTGGGTFMQDGLGTLTLNSTSNGQVVTTVRHGTLVISNNGALGSDGPNVVLDLRSGTTFRIAQSVAMSREVRLGDAGTVLNLDATGRTLNFFGNGATSITGLVVIQGGAVSFNRSPGPVFVGSNASITVNSGASLALAGSPARRSSSTGSIVSP